MQRQFIESVRKLRNLTIYFRDKHTIIVYYDRGTVIFHRWFDRPKGSYRNNWLPFTLALKQKNLKNILEVYRYAEEYDIEHVVPIHNYKIPTNVQMIRKKRKPKPEVK